MLNAQQRTTVENLLFVESTIKFNELVVTEADRVVERISGQHGVLNVVHSVKCE